jgi:hypothetical protein
LIESNIFNSLAECGIFFKSFVLIIGKWAKK